MENKKLLIQNVPAVLRQFRPAVRQAACLPENGLVTGEGGKGGKLGGSVHGGHGRVLPGNGMGQINQIVVFAHYALCPPI